MARQIKLGLDYFPLNVNFSEDEKIEVIEAEFGAVGFYVIIKLFMRIYGMNGYYMMSTEREQKLFAKRINVDINQVNAIIMCALTEKLFDKTLYERYGILTSKGIQTRYLEAIGRRKEVEIIEQYILIDISNMTNIVKKTVNVNINETNVDINSINDDISTQRREEERREEKRKENKTKVEKSNTTTSESSKINFEELSQLYNSTCTNLPKIKEKTEKRVKAVCEFNKQFKDRVIEVFTQICEYANLNDFLCGRKNNKEHPNWKADFDWLININNAVKVLEGKYEQSGTSNMSPAMKNLAVLYVSEEGNKT